jgi:hypothetical protein
VAGGRATIGRAAAGDKADESAVVGDGADGSAAVGDGADETAAVGDGADECATGGVSTDTGLSGCRIMEIAIKMSVKPVGSAIHPAQPTAGMIR